MKNYSLLGILVIAALIISAKHAKADEQAIRSSDNSIWGALGGGFLNYKESIPSPYLADSERGEMPSFAGGVSVLGYPGQGPASNMYFALEGSGTFGTTTYNGAYLATPQTPLQSSTNDHIWTIDGKLGRAFPVGPAAMLIPYGELGYRYWSRNLSSIQTEDYQNGDVLAGLMLQVSPIDQLILTGYGSAGTTFAPQMTTGGYNYDLGSAGMYKIGGKIGYDVLPQVELFTTLDYDAFRYGQSNVVADGTYEPTSKTEDTVWRIGVGYHFN